MKKLLSLIAAFGVMFALTSCGDDDPDTVDLAAPVLTAPAASSVQVGNSVTVSFPYTAAAGFASSSVSATGGTATTTTDGTANATSGTIEVSFTAGTTAGAGSVTLTVIDAEGDETNATAVLTIAISPVPTIAGIPAVANIVEGQTLTVAGPITLTSTDGFAASNAFTLSIDGGAAADLGVVGTATSPVELTDVALPTDDLDPGTYEFLFTLTDGDGDAATFLHTLTVEALAFFVVDIEDLDVNGDGDATLEPAREITGIINADFTFTNDVTWVLAGRVVVGSGATLTIEAGTLIKGRSGTGGNATALLVARDATLNAVGTMTEPIIFTSVSDEILPGEIASPNLAPSVNGLWGGLIVLGNAPISADNESEQIEGIPASDPNGLYGGTDAEDNSGTIRYISVRHGGTNIGEGNEINGITLGGVGSMTTIDHVEVVGNQDDGIEWFGGSVSVSHALVWNTGDDAIDTDQAWSGTLDNFIVINPGDEGFELDGPEGTFTSTGHTITNGTVQVSGGSGIADFDDNSDVTLTNVLFFDISGSQDVEGYTGYAANTNGFASSGWQAVLPMGSALTDFFTGGSDAITTSVADNASATVGADVSEFGFTLANDAGALAGF